MRFFVIVPTYNEKENVERTVNKLNEVFEGIKSHEMNILVTDANSPDGNFRHCKRASKKI